MLWFLRDDLEILELLDFADGFVCLVTAELVAHYDKICE